MSIKDLFKKPVHIKSLTSGSDFVESSDFIVEKLKQKETFQPHIDLSDPANFAKFGSAEKYYVDAI